MFNNSQEKPSASGSNLQNIFESANNTLVQLSNTASAFPPLNLSLGYSTQFVNPNILRSSPQNSVANAKKIQDQPSYDKHVTVIDLFGNLSSSTTMHLFESANKTPVQPSNATPITSINLFGSTNATPVQPSKATPVQPCKATLVQPSKTAPATSMGLFSSSNAKLVQLFNATPAASIGLFGSTNSNNTPIQPSKTVPATSIGLFGSTNSNNTPVQPCKATPVQPSNATLVQPFNAKPV